MKLGITDILFMIFIGPIPPGFLKTEPVPETTPEQLEVPSTEVGTPLGILFGRRHITELHVVYYGDVEIRKIKVDAEGKK